MKLLIVQLSDLHVQVRDVICERWDALCRCVAAEIDDETGACAIVLCGDAAFGGKPEQFTIARGLLARLKKSLDDRFENIVARIVVVPGNHDCDLTAEDQQARELLRARLTRDLPAASFLRVLLDPQRAFFNFASDVCRESAFLSPDQPFCRYWDLVMDQHRIRFHLLNSAWSSVLHEREDLRFPISAFQPPLAPTADYAVAVLHHPLHWFLMPDVRRELRDKIESNSDLVLTGHDHESEASKREVFGGPDLEYLEGGVLQDVEHPDSCSFNTVSIDFASQRRTTKCMRWAGDHFEATVSDEKVCCNQRRADLGLRLLRAFEESLDEFEDPLNHPREPELRLSHLFAYPDLRKLVAIASGSVNGKHSQVTERVRSDRVFGELSVQPRALIVGGDKSGKSTVGKRIFADLHRAGKVPLLLKGSDLGRSGSDDGTRRVLEKAVRQQYEAMTPAEHEQLPIDRKALIIDDLQDGPESRAARARFLRCISGRFGQVVLIASDDFYLEVLSERTADASELLAYQRYDICDFAHRRLEDLAERWLKLGRPEADPESFRAEVLVFCEKVESLLAVAGLPHTPWLLLVILEQADSTNAPTVRNGSYGHLYQAVITVALARSQLKQLDISGKYTYLAELAHHLHCLQKPSLNTEESRAFHAQHCQKYDLPLDYERVRDDLVETRVLRLDGDQLSFRHKYVYCFFVAWWLSRNIHRDVAKEIVRDISSRLHHDVSANILVFLAHLSDDPLVLAQMKQAASDLFSESPMAVIDEEVRPLNALGGIDGFFSLPPTPPEINRKLMQEAEDEHLAKLGPQSEDGRLVRAVPDEEERAEHRDLHRQLNRIRAAIRTVRILGQVLRNRASSLPADDKLAVMEAVVGLGRRLLGFLYGHLNELDAVIADTTDRALAAIKAGAAKPPSKTGRVCIQSAEDQATELRNKARLFANRFWFDLHWLATASMIRRVAVATGMDLLEGTFSKLKARDDCLPNQLVQLSARLNRRERRIPADEIVRLHRELKRGGNKLAQVVLEAIVYERLLLLETHHADAQQVCKEMGIKVPVQTLDFSRKKFAPFSKPQ